MPCDCRMPYTYSCVPPFWFLDQCDYKREAVLPPPGGALSYIHPEQREGSRRLSDGLNNGGRGLAARLPSVPLRQIFENASPKGLLKPAPPPLRPPDFGGSRRGFCYAGLLLGPLRGADPGFERNESAMRFRSKSISNTVT